LSLAVGLWVLGGKAVGGDVADGVALPEPEAPPSGPPAGGAALPGVEFVVGEFGNDV
jgi:hypothetical protein